MLEKYGMGRDWWDFVLLPYNVLVHAKPYSDQFLGRIHPLWALVFPIAISTKQYRLLAICIVSCMFWAVGPHWIRHLIVFLPLCALLFSSPKRSIMRWIWVVYFILLPWQLSNSIVDLEDQVEVFLNNQIGTSAGTKNCRMEYCPMSKGKYSQSHKCIFSAWTGLGTERFSVLGSVEENTYQHENG